MFSNLATGIKLPSPSSDISSSTVESLLLVNDFDVDVDIIAPAAEIDDNVIYENAKREAKSHLLSSNDQSNHQFEEVLRILHINQAQREELLSMSKEMKWNFIVALRDRVDDPCHAAYSASLLLSPKRASSRPLHDLKLEVLMDIVTCSATHTAKWTEQFVQAGGIRSIISLLEDVAKPLSNKPQLVWRKTLLLTRIIRNIYKYKAYRPHLYQAIKILTAIIFQHWHNSTLILSRQVSTCEANSIFSPLKNRIEVLNLLEMVTELGDWNVVMDAVTDANLQSLKDKNQLKSSRIGDILRFSRRSVSKSHSNPQSLTDVVSEDRLEWFMNEVQALVAEKTRDWSGRNEKARSLFLYAKHRSDFCTLVESLPVKKVKKELEKHAVALLVAFIRLITALVAKLPNGSSEAREGFRKKFKGMDCVISRLGNTNHTSLKRAIIEYKDFQAFDLGNIASPQRERKSSKSMITKRREQDRNEGIPLQQTTSSLASSSTTVLLELLE